MKRTALMVVILAMFFLVVVGCGGDESSDNMDVWCAFFGICVDDGNDWPWSDMEIPDRYSFVVELSITDENGFVIPDFVETSLYTILHTENCGSFIYSATPLLSDLPCFYPQRASTENYWTYKESPTAFVEIGFQDYLPEECGTNADGEMTIMVNYPGYAVASTTYIFYLESSWDLYNDPEATIYLQLVPDQEFPY